MDQSVVDEEADFMNNERMSWKEIQEKYPDQWVGLVEVKYHNDDGISIESGIVKYTNKPKGELTRRMLEGEIDAVYTTPDHAFQMGMVGVFG
ncbi:MAG: hypothetical protein IJ567_12085 [Lachnospiraceae bacterium]|nr:hypothetical protein [Lachnospiraceae bacterium]